MNVQSKLLERDYFMPGNVHQVTSPLAIRSLGWEFKPQICHTPESVDYCLRSNEACLLRSSLVITPEAIEGIASLA